MGDKIDVGFGRTTSSGKIYSTHILKSGWPSPSAATLASPTRKQPDERTRSPLLSELPVSVEVGGSVLIMIADVQRDGTDAHELAELRRVDGMVAAMPDAEAVEGESVEIVVSDSL
ncbi:MAG: hypothetical protein ACJAQ9_003044 [Ilumatobacter sp.]|jgi:hypothetical protein